MNFPFIHSAMMAMLVISPLSSFSYLAASSPSEECAQLLFSEEVDHSTLDFETALTRTYTHAPDIHNSAIDIDIREAETLQASLWPNPEFSAEFDNVGVFKKYNDDESAENTYLITQLFELGGKRCARLQLAQQLELISIWNQEILREDLRLGLTTAFINTCKAQELLKLALQQKRADEEIFKSVVAKVENGKVAHVQQYKAEILLAKSSHEFEHAYRIFLNTRNKLSLYWGSHCSDFDFVAFPLYTLTAPPSLCDLESKLEHNPDLYKLELEIAVAEEEYNLQKSYEIPDVLVSAGFNDFRESGKKTATVGFIIPIPVFDRNQGNIAASRSKVCLSENKLEALKMKLHAELVHVYQELTCSFQEVSSIRDLILKKAELSYDQINEGYKQGKYELLDLLETRQTLVKVQSDYVQALEHYHQQKAIIDRLIGNSINE